MIEIIPAISVVKLRVARVQNGNLDNIKIYDERPLDMALKFQDHGIKKIHLIDIEGARKGRIMNQEVIETIAGYTDLAIDFGGGINDDDDIRLAFEHGANAIHASTIAVNNKDLFSSWIISYGRNKIILGADVNNDKIATRGWSKSTEVDVLDLVDYFHNQGILYVKCTDINCDDSLAGPPFDLYKKILNKFPDIRLMASGGVRSVDDIDKLQDLGVYGVIFAKAYYEGLIKLKDLEKYLC